MGQVLFSIPTQSAQVDEEQLKQAFAACGEILGVRINTERKGRSKGKSKGSGEAPAAVRLVVFATEEAQKKAVETMNEEPKWGNAMRGEELINPVDC
eukprot:Skav228516  [mRNA]  locus=scaffold3621:98511:99634:- [translate_table: standard]